MNILYGQSTPVAGSEYLSFLPLILIALVFYFLILRPQTQQRKKHEDTLKHLKKGDKIITRGGIYGTISNFQGRENSKVIVDVGGGTKLNISRSYIAGLATIDTKNK